MHSLFVTSSGLALWALAATVLGGEPWDSRGYVGFYLGALGLCALFGWLFEVRAWRWGLVLVLTQAPVSLLLSLSGARDLQDGLVLVGLAYLAAQTLPAIFVAWAASRAKQRVQAKSGSGGTRTKGD
jgi:hypothetical protein